MTIDEAIAQEKFKARVDRIKANKRIFHDIDEDGIIACNISAEEHEQLAEWLEELKKYKEKPEGYLWDEAVQQGYNKAVDDFIEKIELKYLGVHPDELYEKYYPIDICNQIKELAEQLKEFYKDD